jgi:MFS family permease
MATDDPTRRIPDRDATVVSPPVTAPPAGHDSAPGAHATGAHPVDAPAGHRATRGAARDAVAVQHDRFGGIKWGAAFFGWLSANGLAVILVALLSAAGVALGLASNVDTADEAAQQAETVGLGGGIAVLVVLFLAYLAGGYVAGRMARFDGVKQGLATWLIGLLVVLLLAVAGAVLGAQYNVLQQLNLPRIPVDEGTATTAGIITLVAILLVTLLGAILGGKLGDRYHRKIDRAGFDA